MAAKKEDKGLDIVNQYLSQAVKRKFTLKTGIKLFALKLQMIVSG